LKDNNFPSTVDSYSDINDISQKLLITSMFVHGHSPSLLTKSLIIKGSNIDKNDSANYRAIILSSILCKIIDLIIINRYSALITSPNQFGFKPRGSTVVSTFIYLFIYWPIYTFINTYKTL